MITPLMHILSCLNEKFEISSPISMLYLSRNDWDLIVGEAKRLGANLNDEDKIWITDSPTGKKMVSDVQVVNGVPVNLSPFTALLLTRVWECFPIYVKELASLSTDVVEDDLSADAVVLRLEGNPRYVYNYVYNTMELPSLSYSAKIAKIQELLFTILRHSVVQTEAGVTEATQSRMELHSHLNYWRGMLLSDYVTYYGTVPPCFTESTVEVIRSELSDLGFYGFINPLQMYMDFNGSRVARKVEVEINDEVIEFLSKVVQSGGAEVR